MSRTFFYNDSQPGSHSAFAACARESSRGIGANPLSRRERGRGEGNGRRTEGSAGSAAKGDPSPGRAPRDSTSPIRASGFTQSRRAIPLPPCGGGPTRAKPERGGGGPGIGLSVEAGPPCISRRGKAHVIRQAQPPAAEGLESLVGKVLHARRPPSRSAFGRVGPPHKGEEGATRLANL